MDEEFKNISSEVERLTGKRAVTTADDGDHDGKNSSKKFQLPKIDKFLAQLCGGVFVFVIIVLSVVKPPFVYDKEKDEDRKLSYTKIFIFSLIISTLIIISYFFLENSKFLSR